MVKREDASYKWTELQPKIIGVLIETHSIPKHSVHLDNVSLSWDKMDALIDNIITLGLTPLMQTTHSGLLYSVQVKSKPTYVEMEYLGRISDVASIRLGGDVLLSETAKNTLLAATQELIHFHVPSVRNTKYC